ncbi:hypothetical protein GOBAR_AA11861 [Gossypium barbadense]|uniref:Uncharacterized protein n=1 Tax=Gossypium barbadense TaxID=3634 RepID=A0A2P5XZM1_GOSBA|nr:hypothetical protein GOBAR_AA11861 [Gossypium barbadense]
MSSSHGKKVIVPASKKRKGASSSSGPTTEVCHPFLKFPIEPQEEIFQILRARHVTAGRCIDWVVPTYLEITMELCSMFHLQTVMTNYDDPGTVQFCLGGLVCQLSASKFGGATYNPSRSKSSALPPYLRYLHAILAHTIIGWRESTGVVNTHDAYFLWCISHGHVIDLAYFIALAILHQMEWHRKGVISIGPYVTQLARHFGLLSTAAQESSLTVIGQMSPQGISSMLSMRMIEKR